MKRALEPPRGTGPNDPPRGKKDDISLCLPRKFARARLRVTASKPSTRRLGGHHDKLIKKGTLLDIFGRFLSCNSSKGCPQGVPFLLLTGGAHVGRQDVGLCARDCGVPSRSVARWSPAWRRTRATTLREKMVSKSRWNRFRDAVVPPPTRRGAPRV